MIPTRRLVSSAAVLLLVLLVTLFAASPTLAGRNWCRRDPLFVISGPTQVNVEVAVPEGKQSEVNGPVEVTLYVPRRVIAEVVFTDEGFNGFGEVVQVVEDPALTVSRNAIPLIVQAAVPAKQKVSVALFITPASGRPGNATSRTNRVVIARASVPNDAGPDRG